MDRFVFFNNGHIRTTIGCDRLTRCFFISSVHIDMVSVAFFCLCYGFSIASKPMSFCSCFLCSSCNCISPFYPLFEAIFLPSQEALTWMCRPFLLMIFPQPEGLGFSADCPLLFAFQDVRSDLLLAF